MQRVDVETAAEMFAATIDRITDVDLYIGAAAISDYRPEPAAQKIKKRSDRLTLEMAKSPDLLASIASRPGAPFTVGFAAETERVEEYARQKLEAKRLDMIVANEVGAKLGFDEDQRRPHLWRDGRESSADGKVRPSPAHLAAWRIVRSARSGISPLRRGAKEFMLVPAGDPIRASGRISPAD